MKAVEIDGKHYPCMAEAIRHELTDPKNNDLSDTQLAKKIGCKSAQITNIKRQYFYEELGIPYLRELDNK